MHDDANTLFCQLCGKVRNAGDLKSVRFQGFTGPASLSDNMERFWNTGDARVFEKGYVAPEET